MEKLDNIKSLISSLEGKKVEITTRERRGKIDVFKGHIDKVYPTFFNIETSGVNKQQMSFNFVDILTSEIAVHSKENSIVVENTPE